MLRLTTILLLFVVSFHFTNAQNPDQNIKLPPIGKWLEKRDGAPANWLGAKYQKKELLEPINVVIVDPFAKSREEAIAKLITECRKFGYKDKKGHSWGYCAEVGGAYIHQLPDEYKRALANRSFLKTNNHGRIMGPEYYDGQYVFVGAFSREVFQLFTKAHHAFRSFLIARNDFCQKLDKGQTYKIVGRYNLGNNINTNQFTTGDHDGTAILLYANR
ncbi:MAG: hypothetical protein H6Q17_1965 [Bacteroidetes bacterium]|nr:hypothetical protein [Bacteroidota bacterium]